MTNIQRISMEAAKQNLDINKSIVLLDIRTREEYIEGHIDGAINIPLNELQEHAEKRILRKNQTIYLYCRSGIRTLTAGDILADLGYTSIYDMGGIIFWPYKIVK